jgi:hypothetical protein
MMGELDTLNGGLPSFGALVDGAERYENNIGSATNNGFIGNQKALGYNPSKAIEDDQSKKLGR